MRSLCPPHRSPEVARLKDELGDIARAKATARSQIAGGMADLARLEAEEDSALAALAVAMGREHA